MVLVDFLDRSETLLDWVAEEWGFWDSSRFQRTCANGCRRGWWGGDSEQGLVKRRRRDFLVITMILAIISRRITSEESLGPRLQTWHNVQAATHDQFGWMAKLAGRPWITRCDWDAHAALDCCIPTLYRCLLRSRISSIGIRCSRLGSCLMTIR